MLPEFSIIFKYSLKTTVGETISALKCEILLGQAKSEEEEVEEDEELLVDEEELEVLEELLLLLVFSNVDEELELLEEELVELVEPLTGLLSVPSPLFHKKAISPVLNTQS